MSFSKNSTVAKGTPFSCAKHGDKNKKDLGIKMWPWKYGRWWLCAKARSRNTLEQEMETKDHSDKVRQRKDDHHNNEVRPPQNRSDQCVLPTHREDVQKHRDPLQQQETHQNHRGRPQRSAWTWHRLEKDSVGRHTTGQPNKRGSG